MLKIKEIIEVVDGEVFNPEILNEDKNIEYAFSADLMSDALMLIRKVVDEAGEKGVLITGLLTNQSIRTAEMLDIEVILFARDKKPSQSMIELATDSNILLLGTAFGMYSSNGLLFKAGLKGVEGCVADGICNQM